MDPVYSDRVVLASWSFIVEMRQFCGDFRSKMPLQAVASVSVASFAPRRLN